MGFSMRRPKPLELPSLTENEINAIKSLASGVANEGQQKIAVETLLRKFCSVGVTDFDADGRVHAFNSGKTYVGLQLLHIIDTNIDDIPRLK